MARSRVLIVKLSSLGDLFHALPAVHCLKSGLDAEIDWVVQPEYADLLTCFGDVAEGIPFPRHSLASGLGPFLRRLRRDDYDLIVDLQGLLKSALVTRLARGRRRIGPSFHREGARLFYDEVAGRRDKNRHAVDENLDVVRHLGLPLLPPRFPVRFPGCVIGGGGVRVAVVPVSRGRQKNWPLASFAAAARKIRDTTGATLYLIGSAADREACAVLEADLARGAAEPRVVNLAGQTSLVEMGGWMAGMNLVLANDSGPIHMAAAIGVPVLAVFGPTDPDRTGPYGKGHRVVTADVACRPCFRKHCRHEVPACLAGITPDRVAGLAVEMLGGRG